MRIFRILSVCGTGIATSTVVSETCKRLLKERGMECVVQECRVMEVEAAADTFNPDVIINTAQVSADKVPNVRKFRALQFLTGVGDNALADEIEAYLKTL